MSQIHPPHDLENPFCTRHIRPGARPYLFRPGEDAATLLAELDRNGGWGEITGPHGSGKSALLFALAAAIEQAGRNAFLVELHDGQRRLPVRLRREPKLVRGSVLLVDGYEQLSWFSRWRVRRFCSRRRMGLVATTHRPMGLPPLVRLTTSLAVARRVVAQLQAGRERPLDDHDVVTCFSRSGGDLRQMLFDLYDCYEARQRR